MAEIVQQVIESSIQNLSILERYGLFDGKEIKLILKKQREFEYRLRKISKSTDDFLRYILYEQSLLKLIRIRREKSGLEIDRNQIEYNFIDHIKKLFEFAINKFKFDIPLWLSYIDFAKSQNLLDNVSTIFFRLLQIHNKDWIWLKFAKFEFEEKSSSETARKVFLRCINFHSDSKQVWHEYFRFELLYCLRIRKRFKVITNSSDQSEIDQLNDKQSNDSIWKGELALIVYKHSIIKFPDFDFAANFIHICNLMDYETTLEVKKSIFEDIESRFGACEDYCNLNARSKLEEYKQKCRSEIKIDDKEKLKIKTEAIQDALAIYENSCLNFDNEIMWRYYLIFRFEDLQTTKDTNVAVNKISEILFSIDKLWKENKITCDIFKEWTKLFYICNKPDSSAIQKLQNLLLNGAERWPYNIDIHIFIATLLIKVSDSERLVEKFFEDSIVKTCSKIDDENINMVIDFWELYLDWSVKKKISTFKIKKIIAQLDAVCIYCPRVMSEHFKSKILSIVYKLFGIQKARSHYEQNKSISPICKSFCYKMIEIENHFSEMDEQTLSTFPTRIVSIYEDLVHYFGSDDFQIWIDYLQLLMPYDMTKVGAIYEKALKSIDSSMCPIFVQQYSLLRSSLLQK